MQEALDSINNCETRRAGANLGEKKHQDMDAFRGGENNCSFQAIARGLLTTQ